LLSDFPVDTSDYKRLSKLVLYAALSRESQDIIQSTLGRKTISLSTTAFSNNPVSMKYRGVFDLLYRRETEGGEGSHDTQKYALQYLGKLGQWTLAMGLETWKEKYGKAKRQ